MSQVLDAGAYTITTGIYRGQQHVFVTHRETGKQWVAKDQYDGRNLSGHDFSLQTLILCGMHKFNIAPRVSEGELSCDTRFWMEVDVSDNDLPTMPRSEWDALVFVGE